MKIAMTGASGFVGSHLSGRLESNGHSLIKLGRRELQSTPEALSNRLQGCDAIINLAGENIARRWTAEYKQAIYDSRILTTRLLVEAIALMEQRPDTFISTSAMGAFDSEGHYSESDPPNAGGFFGKLTRDWEQEASRAIDLGLRLLIFRFALVLGADGGMMKPLLLPFRLGLGGPISDGSQPFSWVHIDDLVAAYPFVLEHLDMMGIYHLSAPDPTTNLGFAKTLGRVLHRPTLLAVPKPLLKLLFGEGAEAMTSGQYLIAERLPEAGFRFRYDTLSKALEEITGRSKTG